MDRATRVGLAAGVLAGLGVVGWFVVGREQPPEVDPVEAAAVLPVIDQELERGPWRGLLESEYSELGPRWFCAERLIEIRRTGDELAVGVEALCEEFARDGEGMVTGSAERAPKVVVLVAESDGYRVSGVDSAPDGDAFDRWVRDNFSAAGAAELDRRNLGGDATAEQARQAFGLPADAPVRPVP